MKSIVSLISALLVTVAASAAPASSPVDPAAAQLAATGSIVVENASSPHRDGYAEIGSFRDRVELALGTPSAVLRDGTYVYADFSPAMSEATGTLIVQFEKDRVTSLSLSALDVEQVAKEWSSRNASANMLAVKR